MEYSVHLVRTVVEDPEAGLVVHSSDHGGEKFSLLRSVETEHPFAHGNSTSDLIAHSEAGLGDLTLTGLEVAENSVLV